MCICIFARISNQICILNTHTSTRSKRHQNHPHRRRCSTIDRAKNDARVRATDLTPRVSFRPTYLSGELNTSRPGERGSKALPRRPMRVDAASEPSARDAARGVIGLSAFANNRKGDARSADTCVVCASMDRVCVSVSLSLSLVEYKWEKISSFHSVRCRSTIANANAPRASVIHPSRNPRIANIEKRAGKRNGRHHHVRTSSVGRAGRSGVFASTSSSFVVVIGCSSASAAAVRPRRVVRRRPDIVFARVALTRRETSRRASRGGLFHMSERFPCVRIVYFYRCVRATIGVGFFIPFHPCLCFSSSSFQFHLRRRTRHVGVHVGVSDMWKRRGWASTVD